MDEAAALARSLAGAVRDERVLAAIAAVPRHPFVPQSLRDRAYEDVALPIDCEQTISQPLVVARMLALLQLRGDERVLDVGTGSGWHAALLGWLSREVWTVERHLALSAAAAAALAQVGAANVTCVIGDGCDGLPEQAPFDAINVAAAAEDDLPATLARRLAPGGRLVAPVGHADRQHLVLARRTRGGIATRRLDPVRFVPLLRGIAE
ncbi:MAG: protein-L-isoaspartate(D-aspartate) O-methyltransferase [Solirubrobacteraceae bacterium]